MMLSSCCRADSGMAAYEQKTHPSAVIILYLWSVHSQHITASDALFKCRHRGACIHLVGAQSEALEHDICRAPVPTQQLRDGATVQRDEVWQRSKGHTPHSEMASSRVMCPTQYQNTREQPTSDLGWDAKEETAECGLLAGLRLDTCCVPVSQSQEVAVFVQHGLAP